MKRRKRTLEGLEQDIRDHIESETQDNIARGMPPDEAKYAALRKFGNVARVQEETREVWTSVWFDNSSKTSATDFACCAAARSSPWWPSSLSPSVSERTPQSSRWFTRFCCNRFRIPIPIASPSFGRDSATTPRPRFRIRTSAIARALAPLRSDRRNLGA